MAADDAGTTDRIATERTGGAAADGRTARSQRTREAVVTALLELLSEGNPRPTAREIAARAHVSLRSVYVHFDDVEDLFCEAARQEGQALAALLQPLPTAGPFGTRLDAFLDQRVRLFEALAPVRRAAILQEPFSRSLSRILVNGRRRARDETATVFAQELDGRPGLLDAADLVSSSEAWEQLRVHQRLSPDTARAVVRATLSRVLQPSEDGA
jgi:AcrR family transcriptional regulator